MRYSIIVAVVCILSIVACNTVDAPNAVSELLALDARLYSFREIVGYSPETPMITKKESRTNPSVSDVGLIIMNPNSTLGQKEASLINALSSLKVLRISGCHLKKEFFAELRLKRIEYIYARGCTLSIGDVEAIAKARHLKFIDVGKANITKEWKELIKKENPNVQVYAGQWPYS